MDRLTSQSPVAGPFTSVVFCPLVLESLSDTLLLWGLQAFTQRSHLATAAEQYPPKKYCTDRSVSMVTRNNPQTPD